jgi:hypothetical protein
VNAVEICQFTGGSVVLVPNGVAVGRAGHKIVISLLVNVNGHCYSCVEKYV